MFGVLGLVDLFVPFGDWCFSEGVFVCRYFCLPCCVIVLVFGGLFGGVGAWEAGFSVVCVCFLCSLLFVILCSFLFMFFVFSFVFGSVFCDHFLFSVMLCDCFQTLFGGVDGSLFVSLLKLYKHVVALVFLFNCATVSLLLFGKA